MRTLLLVWLAIGCMSGPSRLYALSSSDYYVSLPESGFKIELGDTLDRLPGEFPKTDPVQLKRASYTLNEYKYPGISFFSIGDPTRSDADETILRISVTGKGILTAKGLTIGDTREDVLSRLGPATRKLENYLEYATSPNEAPMSLYFFFDAHDRVVEIVLWGGADL